MYEYVATPGGAGHRLWLARFPTIDTFFPAAIQPGPPNGNVLYEIFRSSTLLTSMGKLTERPKTLFWIRMF